MSNAETVKAITTGYRLECPEGCPKQIYELIFLCWNNNPEERPTFLYLFNNLKKYNPETELSDKIVVDKIVVDNIYKKNPHDLRNAVSKDKTVEIYM